MSAEKVEFRRPKRHQNGFVPRPLLEKLLDLEAVSSGIDPATGRRLREVERAFILIASIFAPISGRDMLNY